ncbi:hypothetical protein K1719_005830 [Acacia pycnantha]|nr:hypothetical protein K1719_005830 [Acacia pycnantha]
MLLDRRRSSLQTLLKSGFSPTVESINQFLLFLLRLQKFDLILHFFPQLNSNRIDGNHGTQSVFTWALLKSHKFDEAELLMKNRIMGSSRLWDALIQGFAVNREDPERAFFLLEDCLRNRNVLPSPFTFGSIIHRLSSQGSMGKVIDVLELMANAKVEYPFDNFICSSVISGFCKIGKPELALGFFEKATSSGALQPDVVTYTALVSALGKLGDVKNATGYLAKMLKDGQEPNKVTYTAITAAYCMKGKLEEALTVFKNINALGIEADEFMFATLINGFSQRGDFDNVFHLLDEMEKMGISASIVTYNTVINGLCKFGRTSEADEFSKIVTADIITYSTLLHGHAEEENIPGILQTKKRLEEAQISLDVVMCNVLIKALIVLEAFEDAYAVYKWMPEIGLVANAVTFCTMIGGYCKVGRIEEALAIFDEFRKTSISSHACYNSIINGLCKEGIVEMATELFIELNDKGLVLDTGSISIVHDDEDERLFHRREGYLPDANHVFRKMVLKGFQPKLQVYNSLLDGISKIGQLEEVLKILDDMETKHIQPDYFTVSAVINCYCQKGDLEGALAFFDEFKSKDILPDFLGFLYLIRGLCSKGRMEEARSVLREMLQIKPIAELIDVIDSEVETESISDFLVFLCEQGRIQEAVRVLNEIASILFPARRLSTSNQLTHKQTKVYEGKSFGLDLKRSAPSSHKIDLDVGSCDDVNGSDAFISKGSHMTRSQLHDFDFYYSGIAALCSKGELHEASQLAKELLSDLTRSHAVETCRVLVLYFTILHFEYPGGFAVSTTQHDIVSYEKCIGLPGGLNSLLTSVQFKTPTAANFHSAINLHKVPLRFHPPLG